MVGMKPRPASLSQGAARRGSRSPTRPAAARRGGGGEGGGGEGGGGEAKAAGGGGGGRRLQTCRRRAAAGAAPERDGLRVASRKGDAVAFYNYEPSGELDPYAIHAGLPAPDVRHVAALWFHV